MPFTLYPRLETFTVNLEISEVAIDVARWEANSRVHLLRFKSAAAQRDAMVRP